MLSGREFILECTQISPSVYFYVNLTYSCAMEAWEDNCLWLLSDISIRWANGLHTQTSLRWHTMPQTYMVLFWFEHFFGQIKCLQTLDLYSLNQWSSDFLLCGILGSRFIYLFFSELKRLFWISFSSAPLAVFIQKKKLSGSRVVLLDVIVVLLLFGVSFSFWLYSSCSRFTLVFQFMCIYYL